MILKWMEQSKTMTMCYLFWNISSSRTSSSQIPFEIYEAAYEEEPEEDRKYSLLLFKWNKTKDFLFFSGTHRWHNYFTFNFPSKMTHFLLLKQPSRARWINSIRYSLWEKKWSLWYGKCHVTRINRVLILIIILGTYFNGFNQNNITNVYSRTTIVFGNVSWFSCSSRSIC